MAARLIATLAAAAAQPTAAPPDAPEMLAPDPALVLRSATQTCSGAVGDEIVVCGSRDADERHRLRGAGRARDPDAPSGPLDFQISERVGMEVEPMQSVRSDGYVDRRVVARIRIAF